MRLVQFQSVFLDRQQAEDDSETGQRNCQIECGEWRGGKHLADCEPVARQRIDVQWIERSALALAGSGVGDERRGAVR